MSVKWNPKRGKYEVRWLEGGRHPSRLFDRKGDADAFDLEKKRQRQLGALAPTVMRSRITLAQFVAEDWWPRYAIPNLAEDTRRRYLEVWGTHVLLSEKLRVPLRCRRGWWMVLGGFGLTQRALVVSDFARRCRPLPSRTAWRDLIGAWRRPN
jgi:hypothetical protein